MDEKRRKEREQILVEDAIMIHGARVVGRESRWWIQIVMTYSFPLKYPVQWMSREERRKEGTEEFISTRFIPDYHGPSIRTKDLSWKRTVLYEVSWSSRPFSHLAGTRIDKSLKLPQICLSPSSNFDDLLQRTPSRIKLPCIPAESVLAGKKQ